jgi:hypothetical protein
MLRCQCGGAVELLNSPSGPLPVVERYECVACGNHGTVYFSERETIRNGCLVSENTRTRL